MEDRIYAVGQGESTPDSLLIHYDADGDRDTSFGTGGKAMIAASASLWGWPILLDGTNGFSETVPDAQGSFAALTSAGDVVLLGQEYTGTSNWPAWILTVLCRDLRTPRASVVSPP